MRKFDSRGIVTLIVEVLTKIKSTDVRRQLEENETGQIPRAILTGQNTRYNTNFTMSIQEKPS